MERSMWSWYGLPHIYCLSQPSSLSVSKYLLLSPMQHLTDSQFESERTAVELWDFKFESMVSSISVADTPVHSASNEVCSRCSQQILSDHHLTQLKYSLTVITITSSNKVILHAWTLTASLSWADCIIGTTHVKGITPQVVWLELTQYEMQN